MSNLFWLTDEQMARLRPFFPKSRKSPDGSTHEDLRPTAARPRPANKLTEAERDQIITTCNSEVFASLPPSQIVPRLGGCKGLAAKKEWASHAGQKYIERAGDLCVVLRKARNGRFQYGCRHR